MRALISTVMVAASLFAEALPKVSWTRLAVEPVSFRWEIRCAAKGFLLLLPEEPKRATATSAAGKTDSVA